ncbi:hypothetical protein F5Y15DRAFT_322689 [Xylariaceae sp. FL0016]|nr:hypothetical protein F5Y15DRAFT_322689 [Xylariaceae sp. FL0016]
MLKQMSTLSTRSALSALTRRSLTTCCASCSTTSPNVRTSSVEFVTSRARFWSGIKGSPITPRRWITRQERGVTASALHLWPTSPFLPKLKRMMENARRTMLESSWDCVERYEIRWDHYKFRNDDEFERRLIKLVNQGEIQCKSTMSPTFDEQIRP